MSAVSVPKIFVSDVPEFQDDYVCEDCKDHIENPYQMNEKQFEPTVDYRCTICGKMIYDPEKK